MKIEKGKRYLCLDWFGSYFIRGKYYTSYMDNYLVNEHGDSFLLTCGLRHNFQPVEEPSIEELLKRIEALEKESSFSLRKLEAVEKCLCAANDIFISLENQPCPTAAKFKRIADHAQAITNEIATPNNRYTTALL